MEMNNIKHCCWLWSSKLMYASMLHSDFSELIKHFFKKKKKKNIVVDLGNRHVI